MSTNSSPALAAQLTNGKLRALATGAPTRLPKYPDVPTFGELGFEEANMTSLFGLYAPAGTPQDIIVRINGVVNAALKDPVVAQLLSASDNIATGGTPQAFTDAIAKEDANNGRIIKAANITAN